MNIIYARMQGYNWSVPSDAVARELERLGHKITIIDGINYIPPSHYDFVWSPYESVTILGDAISKQLNIPHIAHIEWFPPWRIFKDCDVTQYGFTGNEPEITKESLNHNVNYYTRIGKTYLNAQVRTLSSEHYIDYMSRFLGAKIKPILRYPNIDVRSLKKTKQMYSPKKIPNRIITISRAVPNKRYDLLLKVVNQIETEIEWCVIGDGPMIEYIKKNLTNNNVTFNPLGALWGWAKNYELMKSAIYLGGWTAMPPIEAILLGVYPILVSPDPTNEIKENIIHELFNNHIKPFTEDEAKQQIVSMAIKAALQKTPSIEETKTAFLNNEMGVTSSETNAKQLVELVQKTL